MISNISGFPEYLPEYQIVFNKIIDMIKEKFELYGFSPLDTPAVERVSTLLAKGNDNEIYGIYRLGDPGDTKDLALRFDLTVPLARYVAQHSEQLVFPYRRYHIAPVWRGERPQSGRYRQFYQCDIDIIDTGDLSITNDAEVLSVAYEILKEFGIDFDVRINNRKLLNGIIQKIAGIGCDISEVLKIIDKKDKIDRTTFRNQLALVGLSDHMIDNLIQVFDMRGEDSDMISSLSRISDDPLFVAGVNEIKELLEYLAVFGVDNVRLDLTLARGLTYYTGNVFEISLCEPDCSGSIAGGGRYDDLTSLFCKPKYPGVGIALGISRLMPMLLKKGIFDASAKTPAKVLVTTQDPQHINDYIGIANQLRRAGVPTEMYLQNKKLGKQMLYADRKGFMYTIIADHNELEANKVNIKNMRTGEQRVMDISDIINGVNYE